MSMIWVSLGRLIPSLRATSPLVQRQEVALRQPVPDAVPHAGIWAARAAFAGSDGLELVPDSWPDLDRRGGAGGREEGRVGVRLHVEVLASEDAEHRLPDEAPLREGVVVAVVREPRPDRVVLAGGQLRVP